MVLNFELHKMVLFPCLVDLFHLQILLTVAFFLPTFVVTQCPLRSYRKWEEKQA